MNDEEIIDIFFRKYKTITQGSHFVKREYLAAWSYNGTNILTSINGGCFASNSLRDVCTERYMYEMKTLSDIEVLQLKYFYKNSPEIVRKVNDDFINNWQIACKLTESIEKPNLQEIGKKIRIQTGEDMQTNFESSLAEEIKTCLLNYDESFINNPDLLLSFGLFIFSQYLRTQKQRDNLVEVYKKSFEEKPSSIELDPSRIWNPLITILSNMSAFTLICRENLHIKFITSDSKSIITSDQPIINIAANKETDYFKFYYPINPELAIIFPVDKNEVVKNDDELINEMNSLEISESLRFVFKARPV